MLVVSAARMIFEVEPPTSTCITVKTDLTSS